MSRRRLEPQRAVVTGMGIVSAAGAGTGAFRCVIEAGESCAREAPDLPAPPAEAAWAARVRDEDVPGGDRRDKALRMAAAAAAEAAVQARLDGGRFPPGSALVVGTTLGGALKAKSWHEALLGGGPRRRAERMQAPLHALADALARELGLDGPRTVVSNACASSNDALGLALDLIRAGEAEVVLAGGVDTLHGFNFCGFAGLGAVAFGPCRPFDPERRGMLLGEAAAFLVVESAAAARRRQVTPLAELAGYGTSCDAGHILSADRGGLGAARAMSAALADGRVDPEAVDFVSLHGVGTQTLDAMEAAAMARVFGARAARLPATSLRPVAGHTLGSAGAVDAVACVLAILGGFIPPTPNHRHLDAELPSPLHIVRRCLYQPVHTVLSTSSGFGGANAAVLFRRADGSPAGVPRADTAL